MSTTNPKNSNAVSRKPVSNKMVRKTVEPGSTGSRRTTQKSPIGEETRKTGGVTFDHTEDISHYSVYDIEPSHGEQTFQTPNVMNATRGTGSVTLARPTRRTGGFGWPNEREGTIPWLVNALVPAKSTKSEVDEIRTGPCGCNRQRDPGI